MTRRLSVPFFLLLGLAGLFAVAPPPARAQQARQMQWVWFDEGDPLSDAPAATRYFRRTFTVARPEAKSVKSATLEITADNRYTVWVNGAQVGEGDDWGRMGRYNVLKHLVNGKNVIAVRAVNEGGPAGLVVRLRYSPAGARRPVQVLSDGGWKASQTAGKRWEDPAFDDGKWAKARVLGAYGRVGPWGVAAAGGRGRGAPVRFAPLAGFKVELAVKDPGDRGRFSLVNMTFDPKGRLLVSQEGGPVLVCGKPDAAGVFQEVKEFCKQVRNCQGMRWVKDALYLVGDGPKGTGLYRCRDTKNADAIDEVKLLHRADGGMGEHGPHAIIPGPDGWLYFVMGNHAHARIGPKQAPNPAKLAANSPLVRWPTGKSVLDQGKPGTTEDQVLPRFNDANGHAANILAPGGTIWRMRPDGSEMSLVAAGFRNHFDAAFAPSGELFTFDSDMEWDVGLPWYRAVRAVHVPVGGEFGWRTGSSKIPAYAVDTLPPLYDTGRGSPVGVEFYDHARFGPRYRGAFLMADWSLGIIYAVHLEKKGGTYKPTVEKLLTGTPLNVTDLEVGPDGAVYFTMGGRGTQGGVYRIVPAEGGPAAGTPGDVLDVEQPLSAWGWAEAEKRLKAKSARKALEAVALDPSARAARRTRALTLLQTHGTPPAQEILLKLLADKDADVRAGAVYYLGANGKDVGGPLVKALADGDALVRRRACEALIRAGVEPPVEALWPLLGEEDRFVRTAARLVLQRIDVKKWLAKVKTEPKDGVVRECAIALCKTNQLRVHAFEVLSRMAEASLAKTSDVIDHARTLQLICCHLDPAEVQNSRALSSALYRIGKAADALFPHKDAMANRELANLLTHLRRTNLLGTPVHAKLLAALGASSGDREQQIHYFYCLRFLKEGWTPAQRAALADWYEQTRNWSGGNSFSGFLANIFREVLSGYSVADRKALLAEGARRPQACLLLAQRLQNDRQPELLPALKKLEAVAASTPMPRGPELRRALSEAIVRTACEHPRPEYFADLVGGLSSPNKLVAFDALLALKKVAARPKADDGKAYRAVLVAASKLNEGNKWKAVELLRHWSGNKEFGAEPGEWKPELQAWSRWFGQTFPKEKALPDVGGEKPTPSKYGYAELLDFLTKGGGKAGDAKKGRAVFEKGTCIKCHKYGKEGEGVGPDLTTLAKRFKRVDVLESIYYPSKVISDQYRSTTIVTLKGQTIDGLAAVQGEAITVLQKDGSKVMLKKKDVERQYASLVSVMPEKLLDLLSKEEIADLFAFLESDPTK
jgi:putative heme-binding domain-containing protein